MTAEDIRANALGRDITYWVTNDGCPPAPGCVVPAGTANPAQSGVGFAEVWQYAQSPQRKDVAGRCSGYAHDGSCYPDRSGARTLPLDLNLATSPDPSNGR